VNVKNGKFTLTARAKTNFETQELTHSWEHNRFILKRFLLEHTQPLHSLLQPEG
jgi:hypothetical protein